MATASVWASVIGGRWVPGRGYTHCFNIWNLATLTSQLESEKLRRSVVKIGILAHGDRPGQVLFEANKKIMTVATLNQFSKDIKGLSNFLTPKGKLIFFSCIAGLGLPGDRLLIAISRMLPGRTIVGFNELGWVGAGTRGELGGAASTAGMIKARGHVIDKSNKGAANLPYLTETSPSAKWAKDGYIIRPPISEVKTAQATDPMKKRRCGSFYCPGHKKIGQWCMGKYFRSPGWLQYRDIHERASGLLDGQLNRSDKARRGGRGVQGIRKGGRRSTNRGPIGAYGKK